MTLRSLSFSVITKIKHLFSIIRTKYTTLIVQGAVLVMLEKHNEHYMKVALNMFGVIKTVQLELMLINVTVLNILKVLFLNTLVDGDITTSYHRHININIVKNNVWIIDSHSNWKVLLQKEAIKIKKLKPLLNVGLKASKELNLF